MPANSQPWLVQGSLALATLAIAVASLCFGQYPLSLRAVGHTLVHLPPGEGVIGQIVWSVRLPRVVMALLQTHGFDPGGWPPQVRAKLWD